MDVAVAIAAAERALVTLARGPTEGELDDRVAELALAATCAVSSHFFGVTASRSIGLVGCGPIAALHLAAHRVRHAPRELRCADLDPARAEAFAIAHGGRVTSIAEACACDLVCVSLAGASIERAWVRGGTHLNVTEGAIDDALRAFSHMWGTLAEVAAGLKDGRQLDEITVFVAERVGAIEQAVARSVSP